MTAAGPPQDDVRSFAAEQVRAHLAHVPMALAGAGVAAATLSYALWAVVEHRRLLVWSLALLPPLAWRVSMAANLRRNAQADPVAALRGLRLSFALHGLVWGAAGVLLFPPDPPHRTFLTFIIGGLATTTLTLTAFDLVAGLLILTLAIVPLAGRLLLSGADIDVTMGVALFAFVAFISVNATRGHRRFMENVALRRAANARADVLATLQAALSRLRDPGEADPRGVQQAAVREAVTALRLDRAMLWLFDPVADVATLAASAGPRGQSFGRVPAVPAAALRPYAQSLVDTSSAGPDRAALDEATLAASLLAPPPGATRLDVPLRSAEQLAGVFCCERPAASPWTDDEHTFVTAVAAIALAAVEEEGRRRAERQLRDLNENLERLVAERTRAQAESEERFRAVFDQSPLAFTLMAQRVRQFTEVNAAAIRLFGYTREEFLRLAPADLGSWDDPASAQRAYDTLMREGRVANWEARLRTKQGARFPAVLNFSVVTIGGAPFLLATIEDVTERRRLEESALRAQKMEVVGHLAGGIAHDFNNVLTVMASAAEFSMAQLPPEHPAHDGLSTIRDAGARAAALTRQLLAFGRRQLLQPTVLDLNAVMRDLEPMVERVMGEHVAIRLQLAPGPVTLVADRGSLEQVVLNLALNSRDAMPTGGTFTLATAVDRTRPDGDLSGADGPWAVLTVRDTGSGMDQTTLDRVFEPFFTTKAPGRGTGLGLATAHGIVAQCSGRIDVESTIGAGTTFVIRLPWVDAPAAPARHGGTAVARGEETVLVVDDDHDIRDVVGRALAAAGYAVTSAASGEDALAALARLGGAVDLIVTDVIMPGLNGRQLVEQALARYPHLRVLFTSGYADDVIADQGVLADGLHFLAKPYTLKDLAARVRELLDHSPPRRQGGDMPAASAAERPARQDVRSSCP